MSSLGVVGDEFLETPGDRVVDPRGLDGGKPFASRRFGARGDRVEKEALAVGRDSKLRDAGERDLGRESIVAGADHDSVLVDDEFDGCVQHSPVLVDGTTDKGRELEVGGKRRSPRTRAPHPAHDPLGHARLGGNPFQGNITTLAGLPVPRQRPRPKRIKRLGLGLGPGKGSESGRGRQNGLNVQVLLLIVHPSVGSRRGKG